MSSDKTMLNINNKIKLAKEGNLEAVNFLIKQNIDKKTLEEIEEALGEKLERLHDNYRQKLNSLSVQNKMNFKLPTFKEDECLKVLQKHLSTRTFGESNPFLSFKKPKGGKRHTKRRHTKRRTHKRRHTRRH